MPAFIQEEKQFSVNWFCSSNLVNGANKRKGSFISFLYLKNYDYVNQHLTLPVLGSSPLTAKRLMSLLKHSGKLNKPKILLSRPFDLKNLGLPIIQKS